MGQLSDAMIRHRWSFGEIVFGHPNRLEIDPFAEFTQPPGRPSYGLGSYGYDLRLGREYKYLDAQALLASGKTYVEPKDPALPWRHVGPLADDALVVVQPGAFILAMSYERVRMPRDCYGVVMGKSTWARLGISLNTTMIEPEWEGYITIEVSNHGHFPVGLRVGDGISQLIFHRADGYDGTGGYDLQVSYADRAHPTYQGQTGVTVPTVHRPDHQPNRGTDGTLPHER